MDMVMVQAQKLSDYSIKRGKDYESTVEAIDRLIYKYSVDDDDDELKRVYLLWQADNMMAYEKHMPNCTQKDDPSKCPTNVFHEELKRYFNKKLKALNAAVVQDSFSSADISKTEEMLKEMKESFAALKAGQEILYNVVYDDLLREIEELRNLYFLGKKNWRQVASGKLVEMTVSGVVSEAASKPLWDTTMDFLKKLYAEMPNQIGG